MPSFEETLPEKQHREARGVEPDEGAQQLLERFGELELGQQLEVLRAVIPHVLQRLSPVERSRFMQEFEQPDELQ